MGKIYFEEPLDSRATKACHNFPAGLVDSPCSFGVYDLKCVEIGISL